MADEGSPHIRIERTGGFAGITTVGEVVEPEQARRLLDALTGGAPLPHESAVRDGYRFRFRIERGDAEPEVVELPESGIPAAVRALVTEALRRR
jgi:hypothetical protein